MPTGVYKRIEGKNYGCMTKGKSFWKGKKFPESTKQKHRELMIGDKNPSRKYGAWNKGIKTKPRSLETKLKISKWQKDNKEKCIFWKGGISLLNNQIRGCLKMRQWICDVFERDNYTCQKCQIRGGKLNAHHLKQFSIIILENKITNLEESLLCEELWNINNGQTLCEECHKKTFKNRISKLKNKNG